MDKSPPLSTPKALAAGLLSLAAWLLIMLMGASPAGAHHGQRLGGTAHSAPPAAKAAPPPTNTPSTAGPAPAAASSSAPASVTAELGASGENVRLVEQRLDGLRYEVGKVDGTYDDDTFQAVTAFQKVHGMERTGKVTPEVWSKMTAAQTPPPLVPGGGERRVEIDIARQVLFLYEGNQLAKIITVSSGSGVAYCENGSCGDAVTPTGDFKVYRQGRGWERGPLGSLYNPAYFVGGVAIHGSTSVPAHPASHGCVRIPMSVAEWFPDRVPLGTPVYVR